jgi:hypothetical protein
VRALRLVHAGPPLPLPPQVAKAPAEPTRFPLPPDLEGYFQSGYGPDTRVVSKLKQTRDGPLGTLSVDGVLGIARPEGRTREEHARATTRAFLEKEAALLGLRDLAEIRETRIKFDDTEKIERLRGACYVNYERVLGGVPLIWNTYDFRLKPDGVIGNFHAAIVPVSDELDAAVRHKRIEGARARAIVEKDLEGLGLEKSDLTVGEPTLAGYYQAPFILWELRGRYRRGSEQVSWYYGVDAIEGKIVRRSCSDGRVSAGPPTGPVAGPCDAIPPIPKEPSMLPNPFQY